MTTDGWIVLGIFFLLMFICMIPDLIYAHKHKDEEFEFYDDEDTYW
jgi:hypothetical protein